MAATLPTGVVIALYVVIATGVPVVVHHSFHGVMNWTHAALAFFCGLNALIAVWEIALGVSVPLCGCDVHNNDRNYQGCISHTLRRLTGHCFEIIGGPGRASGVV